MVVNKWGVLGGWYHCDVRKILRTVRDGALGIAYKEFAGDLGPNSLVQIRNQGGRPAGPRFLKARRRRRNFGPLSGLLRSKLERPPRCPSCMSAARRGNDLTWRRDCGRTIADG